MMKKLVSAILVVSLLLVTMVGCNPLNVFEWFERSGSSREIGDWMEGEFSNAWSGLSFTLPEGFHSGLLGVGGGTVAEIINDDSSEIPRFNRRETYSVMDVYIVMSDGALSIAYLNATLIPDLEDLDGAAYIALLGTMHEDIPGAVFTLAGQHTIADEVFYAARVIYEDVPGDDYSKIEIYVRRMGDFFIVITVMRTEDAGDELDGFLNSFERP